MNLRPWKNMLWFLICILVIAAEVTATPLTKPPDFCKTLPPILGGENRTEKTYIALDCDTAVVRKNDTTIIRPGAMVYFVKPTLNSIIKVEGTLIIQGTEKEGISLSGSIDVDSGVSKAGSKYWGGIEVAEDGKVVAEHAEFYKAPTPITSFSRHVQLVNCFFKGSSGIILSDGTLLALDPNGSHIDTFPKF